MCINYKIFNIVILKNKYSLFKIQNCLNMIETTKNFNKINLINDYWQINIIEKNRYKTTFNIKRKKYEFCVMFFDLINASTIFQIIMNDFLRFFFDKFVIVYFDDILIYNKNDEKHLKHLILIFKIFYKKKYFAKS
jgi:hypothetical protein